MTALEDAAIAFDAWCAQRGVKGDPLLETVTWTAFEAGFKAHGLIADAAIAFVTAKLVAQDTARGPSVEEEIAVEVAWHELLIASGRCCCEVTS